MLLNCGVGEDSWETLEWQGDQISQSLRKSALNIHWKDWCWSWNSNTLATWCQELTHWKRPWCWERLRAGGEGDDRGWDGWMASPTQWTWFWASSGSWWRTGKSGVLLSMRSQRVGHDWATEQQQLGTFCGSQPSSHATCPQVLGYEVSVPATPLPNCVNLGKSHPLSAPPAPFHGRRLQPLFLFFFFSSRNLF